MRCIQIWFTPSAPGPEPSVEQRAVAKADRTDRFLPLVSTDDPDALHIFSDARVLASSLRRGKAVSYPMEDHRGGYLYVLSGGPVSTGSDKRQALRSWSELRRFMQR